MSFVCGRCRTDISIHAARVGCDRRRLAGFRPIKHFNPRSPSGLRQRCTGTGWSRLRDFNPRSPSGLRLGSIDFCKACGKISIHAARVGCDPVSVRNIYRYFAISIHAARVGCDYPPGHPELQRFEISIHAARVGCDHGTRLTS